ncbi:osmotic avoidance abnormal protein 3-like isoform X2 [Cylas formicarius]|uniref:osmotic avoidance abnormal protein 3-like isoform X2 n=1 Tax=Cylas formicarius TaxID=197179 RepID=UPI002958A2EA|nr:osmotic avoidance abnormal protein 3-like isoform X2 [Cylas formicarius]
MVNKEAVLHNPFQRDIWKYHSHFRLQTDEKPTIYISYMEIYNEVGYDLLNPRESKTAPCLEELSRVTVLEDKKGEPHLRNLSVLPVSSEEEAMRFFFLGETIRAIAETPMNDYSSRSHCIFTIYISFRQSDQKMKFSKLNLVDLAGSERVYKSQITGTVLNEARHINLSLHFLQQVILALSEARRRHVPYRNSIMTFILKDSLGGNCVTVMLAMLAINSNHLQESISTCKFAQRVSRIKTDPVINEVIDPYQEILLLRNEIQELQMQLAARKTNRPFIEHNGCLKENQKVLCEDLVQKYLNDPLRSVLQVEPDMNQIQYCFYLMKAEIFTLKSSKRSNGTVGHDFKNKFTQTLPSQRFTENFLRGSVEKNFAQLSGCQWCKNASASENAEKNAFEMEQCTRQLNATYRKAEVLADTIQKCQKHINHLRTQLDYLHPHDFQQKRFLVDDLEHQQNIYKSSIVALKQLKTETMHLECNLKRIETSTRHRKVSDINVNYDVDCFKCNCPENASMRMYQPKNDLPSMPVDNENNHSNIQHSFPGSDSNLRKIATSNTCDNFYDGGSNSQCTNAWLQNNYICSCKDCVSASNSCGVMESEKCCGVLNCQNQMLVDTRVDQFQNTVLTCTCDYSESSSKRSIHYPLCICKENCDVPTRLEKDNVSKLDRTSITQSFRHLESSTDTSNEAFVPDPSWSENIPHQTFLKSVCPSAGEKKEVVRATVTHNDFLSEADGQEFKTFIQTVKLSGDPEVDRELIDFYRKNFS